MMKWEAITLLRNLEDSLDSYCELNEEGKTAFRMAIEALSSSEFPNSSDTISRQAAIDIVEFECGEWQGLAKTIVGEIEHMPAAQPFEIQEILDYLDTKLHPIISPEHWNIYSELHDMISTLPSAQPERKKGKWVKIGHWGRSYKCNQCGNYLDFDGVNAGRGSANFCPNCGADMRGDKHE